jgi:enamine deaminase RidA (YjgF/YER057c/UK114 family)
VFVSGQLGLKPGDTEISGSIEEQTEQVLANLRAILEEAGAASTAWSRRPSSSPTSATSRR